MPPAFLHRLLSAVHNQRPSRVNRRWCLSLLLGLITVVSGFGAVPAVRAQQTALPLAYGQTVRGTIGSSATTDAVLYSFQARSGDQVLVTMVRTSGTLRPLIGLADPTRPTSNQVLAVSTLSSDGTTATLNFNIKRSATYQLLATRQDVLKGATSGSFMLTLAPVTPTQAATPSPEPAVTDSNPAETQSFTVGTEPTYSVWSGNNLYVANQGDGTVSILDDQGTVSDTIQTNGVPVAMVWDGARLWVADFGTDSKPGNTVTLYDAAGKKLSTIKVGKQPISMSYDPDHLLTWIALYGDDKIIAVDARGKIVHSIDVSSDGHNPNTVLWTSNQLWATLQGTDQAPDQTVLAIDLSSATITNTITVGSAPADLAWDDADQRLFVANNADGTITALAADGTVIGTYTVGTSPNALAWDGTTLWVTLGTENTVAALSKDGQILNKIPLDNIPNGITFDGQSSVWVCIQGSTNQPGSTIVRISINAITPPNTANA